MIKGNLVRWLNADVDTINIKAKTHEKVDSIGEQRSIACHCVVMLIHDPLMLQTRRATGELDFYRSTELDGKE